MQTYRGGKRWAAAPVAISRRGDALRADSPGVVVRAAAMIEETSAARARVYAQVDERLAVRSVEAAIGSRSGRVSAQSLDIGSAPDLASADPTVVAAMGGHGESHVPQLLVQASSDARCPPERLRVAWQHGPYYGLHPLACFVLGVRRKLSG